jgi:uncharacterized protein (DUF58 family)
VISPTRWALACAGAWLALGAAASFEPQLASAWRAAGIAIAAAAAADAALARFARVPRVTRAVQPAVSRGEWVPVFIAIENPRRARLALRVHDHHPTAAIAQGLPFAVAIPAGQRTEVAYRLRFAARGPHDFGDVELRLASPLRLFDRHLRVGAAQRIRSYPNVRAIARYQMLAAQTRTGQLGVRRRPQRGAGLEFHELREYRAGDSLRQIDWKATARVRKTISREYRDERDQRVVFLLDCGQRLHAKDGERSHFDAAIDAVLLAAHVAVKQGDAVGLSTFSGEPRWLPPRKGSAQVRALLNALYDLESGTRAPDYLDAARSLATRLTKRALVVVVSNLRDDDAGELAPALELLAHRHFVVLASLAESAMGAALRAPVVTLDDALRVASIHAYLAERRRALDVLPRRAALRVDCEPENLGIAMVNAYLAVKAAKLL